MQYFLPILLSSQLCLGTAVASARHYPRQGPDYAVAMFCPTTEDDPYVGGNPCVDQQIDWNVCHPMPSDFLITVSVTLLNVQVYGS